MLREDERKRTDLTVTNIQKRRVLDLVQDENVIESEKERLLSLDLSEDEFIAQFSNFIANTPRHYRQRVFIKKQVERVDSETNTSRQKKETEWFLEAEFFPTDVKGERFTEIPFFVTTDRGINWDLKYSMTYDLAAVNVSHYRNSADLENINHVATNPTPCAIGLKSSMVSNPNIEEKPDSTDEQVALGVNTLLEFEDNGKSWMLESSGSGANAMVTMMDKKQLQMALLGSRILTVDPSQVEAAKTAEIHREGEHGVLSSAVDSIILTFLKVLEFMYMWENGQNATKADIDVSFNKDYIPGRLDPSVVVTALQLVQAGRMTEEEFFFMLQKGEWIKSDANFEDREKLLIEVRKAVQKERDAFEI